MAPEEEVRGHSAPVDAVAYRSTLTTMRHSRYYNLDSIPEGWTPEDFRFAVLTLESLHERQLLALVDQFAIRFTDGNEGADHEDMGAALLDDTEKSEFLKSLRALPNSETRRTRHLQPGHPTLVRLLITHNREGNKKRNSIAVTQTSSLVHDDPESLSSTPTL